MLIHKVILKSTKKTTKNALVAILGRPSVGKSTFLNTACQEPVSIISSVPQTTRNAIRGIVNTSLGQLVFVDTPGYHESEKKLNLKLKSITEDTLDGADCVLYIIDTTRPCGNEEMMNATLAQKHSKNLIIALNKIDSKNSRPADARLFVANNFPDLPNERVLEMSAEKDEGINEVLKALFDVAPFQEPLYPENLYTDQNIEFRVAEIIRGEAINRLSEEIPHCLYVSVADLERRKEGKTLWLRAFIFVERESQKGIVIGKNASMIREIKAAAIRKMKDIFPYKIELDVQVRVDKNWRQHDVTLEKLVK